MKKKEIPTSFAIFENKSRPIRERQLERPTKVPEPRESHNNKTTNKINKTKINRYKAKEEERIPTIINLMASVDRGGELAASVPSHGPGPTNGRKSAIAQGT